MLTSVSSLVSSSAGPLPFADRADEADRPTEPARCRPAFSRSASFHDRMLARRLSISNRLLSPRGVVRKESRTFVTSLRSTLLSVWFLRSRRSASMRCSLRITAIPGGQTERRQEIRERCEPSCRSFRISRSFSLTSFSSSTVRLVFVEVSSNCN